LKYVRAGDDYGQRFQDAGVHPPTISEIRRAAKPFIAAVDGIVAAGGFGLAMSCDLVLASERAWFEWAYAKTGLTGAESSTFFLPRLIGLRRAMEMLFLNPRLDARKALEWGLITAVYPAESRREVMAVANQLAVAADGSGRNCEGALNQAAGMDRLTCTRPRDRALTRIANGANFSEGISAFFEKRPRTSHDRSLHARPDDHRRHGRGLALATAPDHGFPSPRLRAHAADAQRTSRLAFFCALARLSRSPRSLGVLAVSSAAKRWKRSARRCTDGAPWLLMAFGLAYLLWAAADPRRRIMHHVDHLDGRQHDHGHGHHHQHGKTTRGTLLPSQRRPVHRPDPDDHRRVCTRWGAVGSVIVGTRSRPSRRS
jgi:enoyl-CoA hydratase/carnithine racemase